MTLALGLAAARSGHADALPAADTFAFSPLRRLGAVGLGPAPLTLGLAAGYGYTEAVLGRADSHHRFTGTMAGEWQPHPAVALGLRLNGRYDRHRLGAGAEQGTQPGSDEGWTGEPQLHVRVGRAVGATLVALALGVELPGAEAPSIEPRAIGGRLTAHAARPLGPVVVAAELGYRLDRSARALPPAARLSPADRVAAGVNDFDAALVGLGLAHARAGVTLFGEVTWHALVGAGRPPASQWPLVVGLGARRELRAGLTAEALLELAPSARPPLRPDDRLVAVPPRFGLVAGLVWGARGTSSRARTPAAATLRAQTEAPADPATEPAAAAAAAQGQLRCWVRTFGGSGVAATLRILGGPPGAAPRAPLASRDGHFAVELPPGSYELVIESDRLVPQRRAITIEPNGVTLLNADLRRSR